MVLVCLVVVHTLTDCGRVELLYRLQRRLEVRVGGSALVVVTLKTFLRVNLRGATC